MGQSKNERMKELVSLLNKASRAYYQEAQEIMSNYEYDRLYDELQNLEKELEKKKTGISEKTETSGFL